MTRTFALSLALLMVVSLTLLSACDDLGAEKTAETPIRAAPIAIAECAACGMVVRDQPAPRAQVVHRDGTRAHLCSLGELVLYLQAPSPHGSVKAVFVEDLGEGFDPAGSDKKEHAWVAAPSASYVVGVARRGIMGPPVLSFKNPEQAHAAATKHGGTRATWNELTPFVLKPQKRADTQPGERTNANP